MAVFNEIDEGGLNAILTRRLGMPGGSPAPSLAPEIMPQMVLENDRPEWGWLKGEMLCAGYFEIAPVAAQYGYLQFYNPPTSQSIITINQIENINPTDLFVQRSATSILAAGSSVYGGVCDLRFRFRTMQAQTTTLTNPVFPANQGRFAYLNNNVHLFEGDIVLPPDSLVTIAGGAVNSIVQFNMRWYERVAQSGELV